MRFLRIVQRLGLAAALLVLPASVLAQDAVPSTQAPPEIAEISFEQRLNSQVPQDLAFRDSTGAKVTLGDYFTDKPVVLALVYYECPMLCTLALNGMLEAFQELQFTPGKEFTCLTVSFDHEETHVLAAAKKTSYLERYNRPGAETGWHFLVGDEAPIKQLADAVGFQFKYDPESDEFGHRAGLVLITPDGKTSRYFPGVSYDPTDLRLGLVETAEHKIGSLVDKLFLLCYHYDPSLGKYGILITNVINISCGITAVLVLGSLAFFFASERKTRRENLLAEARP